MRLWPASSVPARRLANGPISDSSPIDAILGAHAQLEMAARADRHIAQPRGAVDSHALAELARAENLDVGTDHAIGRDRRLLRDVGARGIDQRHPGRHQLAVNRRTNFRFHLCQLLARVDAGEFRRVVRHPRFDFFAARSRNRDDIGQVILILRVARFQFRRARTAAGRCRRGNMPVLISRMARSAGDASRCSTIFSTLPLASRITRPYAAGSSSTMLMNESLAPHFRCASRNARKVADVIGGHVAVSDEHVAVEVRRNFVEAKSRRVAGAALRLLERESRARWKFTAASTSRAW